MENSAIDPSPSPSPSHNPSPPSSSSDSVLEPVLLDARNLLCPMPVIRLQNKIGKMQKGEEILVLCTDPGTKSDIPTWCRINHREVIWIKEEGFEIHFLVRA
jgi:tRNA 2-thiouridine synthesizing protein A